MSGRTGGVPKEVLDDVVRRIVEVAAPEKIILFGSAARGELGPNSDIDLLVIKGGEYDPGRLAEQIYLHLRGAGAAVDVWSRRRRWSGTRTASAWSSTPRCGRAWWSMPRERFAPDDPREWLNRAPRALAASPSNAAIPELRASGRWGGVPGPVWAWRGKSSAGRSSGWPSC
jgi:hypothetical protein